MTRPFIFFVATALFLLIAACATVDESIIAYDPPGATTETRETEPHHRRMIGAGSPKLWMYNDFDGARANDFYHLRADTFVVVVSPENAPINSSAWYAFHLWTDTPRWITVRVVYTFGTHRYHPKISSDAQNWDALADGAVTVSGDGSFVDIDLFVDRQPVFIAAQELINTSRINRWAQQWENHDETVRTVVGKSHQNRDIHRITIGKTNADGYFVLVFGRQHPPEIPGSLALKAFVDRLLENDSLAVRFRSQVQTIVYPLMNPDGVYEGHWRHNAGGVDLNRDWKTFNQPETRAVRDDILGLINPQTGRVLYGFDFHSTTHDVFYTVNKDLPSWPDGFADRWLEGIQHRLPGYEIREEPFGVAPPIVKNWIYHTFNAGAVTYEVGDTTDRALIFAAARAAAESLMEKSLEELMIDD